MDTNQALREVLGITMDGVEHTCPRCYSQKVKQVGDQGQCSNCPWSGDWSDTIGGNQSPSASGQFEPLHGELLQAVRDPLTRYPTAPLAVHLKVVPGVATFGGEWALLMIYPTPQGKWDYVINASARMVGAGIQDIKQQGRGLSTDDILKTVVEIADVFDKSVAWEWEYQVYIP
jgi:hypothetical protein